MAGFIISFLIIGLMWIGHHRIFRYIADYDAGLLWRNLLPIFARLLDPTSKSKSEPATANKEATA